MTRFPYYSQRESADCGPACLRMIAKYYGRDYSAEMLRKHSFISREGVSMLGISDAAEYIGFKTLGAMASFEQLVNEVALPCILHWNQNHFVVCYGIKKTWKGKYRIYVADPASQKLTYGETDFKRNWISTQRGGKECGAVLLVEPGMDFGKREDDIRLSPKSMTSFLKYFHPYRWLLLQLVVAMATGSLIQLLFPFLTQAMVDFGIQGKDMNIITLVLIAQLMLFIAQLSMEFIRSWILLHINSRIDISLISDFLIKLMSMPLCFFDSKKTGDIMQRIGDHARIKGFLMGNSISILFSATNLIIFGVILGYYNLKILSFFLFGHSLYVIWILWFMRYRRELDVRRFSQASNEQSNVIQLIQGMQDIKLNNCEKQKRWEWEHIQINLFKISVKALTIGQVQQIGSVFFTKSTDFIVSFIAAYSVVKGDMTLGMMMSQTYIMGQVSAPIHDFIGFAHSYQDSQISLERLNEIHAQEDEEHDIEKKLSVLPMKKDIQVKDLTFSYSGAERDYAVEGLTLTVPANKVTAIVGESGSGKTTFIKILQGFYKPNRGCITVGGVNLDLINPHLWRSSTGSVMQESFIFSDTIAKNIALATAEVDMARLYHAAEMANIHDFITSLPMGYNTKIGMEGCGISQGQRQRLLIARAIYKNPEFMFFDEATNSLDATNESIIMNNLRDFYKGKTVIISAHRLSTVKNADNIIVLSKGHVIEQGTHNELVMMKGAYYKLVKNQLELGNG